MRRAARRLMIVLAVVGLALTVGLAIFAQPLIRLLYSSEFEASGVILAVLSAILFLRSLSYGFAALLTAIGQQAQRAAAQLISAITNVGLNVLLVPRIGIMAAPFVYVVSEAVLCGVFTFLVKRLVY